LQAGADVHVKDYQGRTASMLAREEGYTEMVELLKEAGAKE